MLLKKTIDIGAVKAEFAGKPCHRALLGSKFVFYKLSYGFHGENRWGNYYSKRILEMCGIITNAKLLHKYLV